MQTRYVCLYNLLVQLLGDAGVERQHPEAEGELVLDLEVDPPRENGH